MAGCTARRVPTFAFVSSASEVFVYMFAFSKKCHAQFEVFLKVVKPTFHYSPFAFCISIPVLVFNKLLYCVKFSFRELLNVIIEKSAQFSDEDYFVSVSA